MYVCLLLSLELKLFTTDSDPAVSVGVVRHSSEVIPVISKWVAPL